MQKERFLDMTQEKEGEWIGPFCFILASDTQFGLIDRWNKVPPSQQGWDKEVEFTMNSVNYTNSLVPRPEFLVVCGDLVDASPTDQLYDAQVQTFWTCFQSLNPDIPLICVCGNHDFGDSASDDNIAKYRNNFGRDYFSFWKGGVFFLVLNTQYYQDETINRDEAAVFERWLDDQVNVARLHSPKHVVVFQHIPVFLEHIEEDAQYFNIPTRYRSSLLEKLSAAGVSYIFSGHLHKNHHASWRGIEMVTTSAIGLNLGDDRSGMRIVRVHRDCIDHKYYEWERFPSSISLLDCDPLP